MVKVFDHSYCGRTSFSHVIIMIIGSLGCAMVSLDSQQIIGPDFFLSNLN